MVSEEIHQELQLLIDMLEYATDDNLKIAGGVGESGMVDSPREFAEKLRRILLACMPFALSGQFRLEVEQCLLYDDAMTEFQHDLISRLQRGESVRLTYDRLFRGVAALNALRQQARKHRKEFGL